MKAYQQFFTAILGIILLSSFGVSAQNWSLHFSDSLVFNQIIFPDQNTGYIFGDDGAVYKTTNQGVNWNLLSLGASAQNYRLEKSFFFDANNGYASGRHNSLNAVVVKTNDGGASWTAYTNFAERLNGIAFANQTTGVVVGKNGFWYKTTDSGNTWILQTAFTSEDINDVYFTNSTTAIAICDGGEIYKSDNAGTSWTLKNTLTTEDISSLYFLSANNGYASASGGVILKTQDGGDTWSVMNTGVTFDLEDVHFLNASNGYAVGLSNQVLHTTDGGTNWSNSTTTALSDILSIVFVTNGLGYFVTHDGEVFVQQMTTSIPFPEFKNFTASIAPNPVIETSVIKIYDSNPSSYTIELFDIIGNKITEFKNINNSIIELSASGLENGIYLYKVTNSKNQIYCNKFSVSK